MKHNTRIASLGLIASLCAASVAARAATISVGNYVLESEKAGQMVEVLVTGGDAIQGVNFNIQVADGGPEVGGHIPGPKITAVDILGGTIFAANNTGEQDPGSFPQIAIRTTTTSAGTVPATGVLATITFDTTGFTGGSWALSMADTLNGPTDFGGIPATIIDGSIQIVPVVPEPSSLPAAGLAVALLGRRRRAR